MKLQCKHCSHTINRYGSQAQLTEYICQKCRSKIANNKLLTKIEKSTRLVPRPKGIAFQCITCRLEYMRVEGGPLLCPRCDAIRKHSIEHVSI